MRINQEFFNKIYPTLSELKKIIGPNFIIFGSAPLYLLGVLDFNQESRLNDIDIAIRDEEIVAPNAQIVLFHEDPRQKLYKLSINNINVDIGGPWPGQEEYFEKIFKDPVIVDGFKFANLNICQEWKELMVGKYNREKDRYYLQKIKEFKK
ncbi:MAG: hypothetical protein PHY72_02215 [Candidatus Pacebacteria bacterium]|nr:hypothetical protein [Candidatus Paceibacterota bacterium]